MNTDDDDFPQPDPVEDYLRERKRDSKNTSRRIGIWLVVTSVILYFFFPFLMVINWFFPSPRVGHVSIEMILAIFAVIGFLASALVALIASFYVRWAFIWFCIAFTTAMTYLVN